MRNVSYTRSSEHSQRYHPAWGREKEGEGERRGPGLAVRFQLDGNHPRGGVLERGERGRGGEEEEGKETRSSAFAN